MRPVLSLLLGYEPPQDRAFPDAVLGLAAPLPSERTPAQGPVVVSIVIALVQDACAKVLLFLQTKTNTNRNKIEIRMFSDLTVKVRLTLNTGF